MSSGGLATTTEVARRSAAYRACVRVDVLGHYEDNELAKPFARRQTAPIEGAATLRVSPLGERISALTRLMKATLVPPN